MKRLGVVLCVLAAMAYSWDFRQYTTIDAGMKDYLRTNYLNHVGTIQSTRAHAIGNSITYTMAFWAQYQYSSNPGPVPGTDGSTYGDKTCAYSGYRIDNGLACLDEALALHPAVVICEYGTNDLNDKSMGTFPSEYRTLIDRIVATGAIPIISTIPPCRWSSDATYDPVVLQFNDTIRAVAAGKNVPCVDFYQAFMDFTNNNPFSSTWFGDTYVHPSGGGDMTDTTNPTCGYGIRNAVTWQAVNKVYRIIIDNGTPDGGDNDTVAPAAISDLAAASGTYNGTINLTWTATGDDGSTGRASSYNLRYSASAINAGNFDAATAVSGLGLPQTAGGSESFMITGLTEGATYYFAIKASDGVNVSTISNIASAVATQGGQTLVDSLECPVTGDNYAESGSDAVNNWGGKPFIRFKAGNQCIALLKFDLSGVTFPISSGNLYLTASDPSGQPLNYNAIVGAISADWAEGTGTTGGNTDGSSYNERQPSVAWTGGITANITQQMPGVAGSGVATAVLPVSGNILEGYKDGTYYGISVRDGGSSYANNPCYSKEGGNTTTRPRLVVYSGSSGIAKGTVVALPVNEIMACPNPFNPTTTISFSNPGRNASVYIYNVSGKPVAKFLNVTTGSVVWNGEKMASGVYLVKVVKGNKTLTTRVMLQK